MLPFACSATHPIPATAARPAPATPPRSAACPLAGAWRCLGAAPRAGTRKHRRNTSPCSHRLWGRRQWTRRLQHTSPAWLQAHLPPTHLPTRRHGWPRCSCRARMTFVQSLRSSGPVQAPALQPHAFVPADQLFKPSSCLSPPCHSRVLDAVERHPVSLLGCAAAATAAAFTTSHRQVRAA